MRRSLSSGFVMMAAAALFEAGPVLAQMNSGGPGQMPGRPTSSSIDPSGEPTNTPQAVENPTEAAKKAFAAGLKSLNKAKALDAAAANESNGDKRSRALEKAGDLYMSALDQFTEALTNQGDMVDAWANAGYAHLHLAAYAEAIDDYDHALALKPGQWDMIEQRAEACLAVDRLDDTKSAYMDLFNHEPKRADQLMTAMQKWQSDHRADAHGVRAGDIDTFGKWLLERDALARQAAALPH